VEPSASGTGPGRSGSGAVSWSAVVGTYLPALILALGAGVALPAVPALASSFDVGFGVASGVVTAFLLGNLPAGGWWECQVRVGGGVPSATCRGWHPPLAQVAVQVRVGEVFVPFQVPLKPKLVLWPAFKRPL